MPLIPFIPLASLLIFRLLYPAVTAPLIDGLLIPLSTALIEPKRPQFPLNLLNLQNGCLHTQVIIHETPAPRVDWFRIGTKAIEVVEIPALASILSLVFDTGEGFGGVKDV
ncbi:hypothetical protein FGO68_gene6313 [Halteria grandinella]|uniref:Uncharacterized protein n=1 Tax=Halteria grandinella TaxID=5974 RepID=A0A8J8NJ64_HALGN|nr:hypothetical protein FGO68_gene6313 [Halteria grandinella]